MSRRDPRTSWRLAGPLAALLIAAADMTQAAPLRACASDVDFPPFVLTSTSGFAGGTQNTGLAVNVLQRALRRAGREPAIVERLPWRRCQETVAYGQRDIIIDVPTRELDNKRFLATEAYADVHHLYFYSLKRYPKGPPLRSLADLKHHMVCGLLGSHLDAFGIDAEHQDTGSKNERSAIIKVDQGRCDVFIEVREVVDSLSAHDAELRDLFNTPTIRRANLPGETPAGLHFAFSRALPDAPALQRAFNATIRDLIRNNEMKRMTP
ncbi:substrate-binding periplasmic protein [Chromobacterium alticapitis]|nr:transporter substrate-binding domain-containing protein [Chromobacterium alticapitis]